MEEPKLIFETFLLFLFYKGISCHARLAAASTIIVCKTTSSPYYLRLKSFLCIINRSPSHALPLPCPSSERQILKTPKQCR